LGKLSEWPIHIRLALALFMPAVMTGPVPGEKLAKVLDGEAPPVTARELMLVREDAKVWLAVKVWTVSVRATLAESRGAGTRAVARLEALREVRAAPLPEKLAALTVLAEKLPEPSRRTRVLGALAELPEVLALAMVPLERLEALV